MIVFWIIFIPAVLIAGISVGIFRDKQKKRRAKLRKEAKKSGRPMPEEEKSNVANLLKRRPWTIPVTIVVVSFLLMVFALYPLMFPGIREWLMKFFIDPFPWGLICSALMVLWIVKKLSSAIKDESKDRVFNAFKSMLIMLLVTIVVIWSGRAFGRWAGWNIFGSDPHTRRTGDVFVNMTDQHGVFSTEIPLNKECWESVVEVLEGEPFTFLEITPQYCDVSGLSDDGYQGFNSRGAVADTGDGILRNLTAGSVALQYEARLWSKWRNRPADNPVKTDEIRWNVPDPSAPYGALLVELDGEKRFLEVGKTVTVSKTQKLRFFINLERRKFELNDMGKPRGKYLVKFRIG